MTEYRAGLASVSWYMKSINAYVARMTNVDPKSLTETRSETVIHSSKLILLIRTATTQLD